MAEQLDIVMITPLIIRVIFSLTQLARVFAVSGNGEWLLLASQSCSGSHISDIAPRGLSRGHHHCTRRQEEERHLFLLVNANKVLLPNVGLCERGSADPQFLSSSENYSLSVARARPGRSRCLVTAHCKSSRLMTLI